MTQAAWTITYKTPSTHAVDVATHATHAEAVEALDCMVEGWCKCVPLYCAVGVKRRHRNRRDVLVDGRVACTWDIDWEER